MHTPCSNTTHPNIEYLRFLKTMTLYEDTRDLHTMLVYGAVGGSASSTHPGAGGVYQVVQSTWVGHKFEASVDGVVPPGNRWEIGDDTTTIQIGGGEFSNNKNDL